MQKSEQSQLAFIVGVAFSPIAYNYDLSAATHYSFQVGNKSKRTYFSIKTGIFKYNEQVESDYPVIYTINGYFVQPGLIYYLNSPYTSNLTQYFGISSAFNCMNHNMEIVMQDPNWGTQKVLKLNDEFRYLTYVIDYGVLFKVLDNLKFCSSVSLSVVDSPIPFRSEISSYRPRRWFRPSSGFGQFYGFNFYLGVNYTF